VAIQLSSGSAICRKNAPVPDKAGLHPEKAKEQVFLKLKRARLFHPLKSEPQLSSRSSCWMTRFSMRDTYERDMPSLEAICFWV